MITNIKSKEYTQKQIRNELKKICNKYGFSDSNTSSLTLLAPSNYFNSDDAFKESVHELLHGHEFILISENGIRFSDKNFKPGFKVYDDLLPQRHFHILIKEVNYEVRALRVKWYSMVGSKKRRLFHCEYIRESVSDYIDYITKDWGEQQAGNLPMCSYAVNKRECEKESIKECHEGQGSIYSLIKNMTLRLVHNLKKTSRQFSKLFMSFLLVLSISDVCFEFHHGIRKANPPPKVVSNKGGRF